MHEPSRIRSFPGTIVRSLLLTAATAGTGLVAGVFVAFAVAVMPGLHATDARTFVTAMQRINVAIVNPVFLLLFLGSPVLLAVAAIFGGPRRGWIWAGFALTVVSLIVSFAVNIPLNEALARAGSADVEAARATFESSWNTAHGIRTVLTCLSFVAALVALGDA